MNKADHLNAADLIEVYRPVAEAAAQGRSLCQATLCFASGMSLLDTYSLWRLLVAHRAYERPVDRSVLSAHGRLNTDDRVRHALTAEYGHVLDSLRDAFFVVRAVPLASLQLAEQIRAAAHADWSPEMPAALVCGSTMVVDGHHRIARARQLALDTVLVVAAQ